MIEKVEQNLKTKYSCDSLQILAKFHGLNINTPINRLIREIASKNITLVQKGKMNGDDEPLTVRLLNDAVINRKVELMAKYMQDPKFRNLVNFQEPNPDAFPNTLLIGAVMQSDTEMVKLLLDNGADPNLIDLHDKRFGPLHYATTIQIATLLLNAGADPNLRSTSGAPAFFYISQIDDLETDESRNNITLLYLRQGADINAVDNDGDTILFYIYYLNHHPENVVQWLKILVKYGASINRLNNDGLNVFKYLFQHYTQTSRAMAKELLMIGADPTQDLGSNELNQYKNDIIEELGGVEEIYAAQRKWRESLPGAKTKAQKRR